MLLNKTIKAILTKPISFIDFMGRSHSLAVGSAIEVTQIKVPLVAMSIRGSKSLEIIGDFLGSFNGEMFDIDRDEFKTVD